MGSRLKERPPAVEYNPPCLSGRYDLVEERLLLPQPRQTVQGQTTKEVTVTEDAVSGMLLWTNVQVSDTHLRTSLGKGLLPLLRRGDADNRGDILVNWELMVLRRGLWRRDNVRAVQVGQPRESVLH